METIQKNVRGVPLLVITHIARAKSERETGLRGPCPSNHTRSPYFVLAGSIAHVSLCGVKVQHLM